MIELKGGSELATSEGQVMRKTSSILRRWSRIGAVVILGTLSTACADSRRPPVAAMVPQSANGIYGYSDRMLAPGLYAVTYVSPRLRATRDADDAHGLEGEKQRVYDLALWRAAQLAQEKGYPAFQIQQDNRDVDVTVQSDPIYPAYPGPFLFGRHCWNCFWPYGYYPYYGGATYRTRASGRITVNLTVKMLSAATADALSTAATIERLRKAYGSATFALTTA